MTNLIGGNWDLFKSLMDDAHDSFNQDTITWVQVPRNITHFQEDLEDTTGTTVNLKVLVGYNYFRTWPITKHDTHGQIDNQNMLIYLNKNYLKTLGHLTSKGYFNFRPDRDYFIHKGIKYKAEGDSPLSQAYDDPVFIQIILRRQEILTGETLFGIDENKTVIVESSINSLLIRSLEPQILT